MSKLSNLEIFYWRAPIELVLFYISFFSIDFLILRFLKKYSLLKSLSMSFSLIFLASFFWELGIILKININAPHPLNVFWTSALVCLYMPVFLALSYTQKTKLTKMRVSLITVGLLFSAAATIPINAFIPRTAWNIILIIFFAI